MSKVFLAELVPLNNKGEEAIIRGIVDVVFNGKDDVDIAVLDHVEKAEIRYGIHVFPYSWLYPKIFGNSLVNRMRGLLYMFLIRFGYKGVASILLKNPVDERKCMVDWFLDSDYIFLGHDGVFSSLDYPIISCAKKRNLNVGIFGCGLGIPKSIFSRFLVKPVYRKVIEKVDFAFFRETSSFTFMKQLSAYNTKVKLVPDPAFGMEYSRNELIRSYLPGFNIDDERLIVCVTVCENSVVFRQSFLHIVDQKSKEAFHISFLAALFDNVIMENNALVVFLPHVIGKGRNSDVIVALDVYNEMKYKDSAVVLNRDLGSKTLKGIIAKADFVIAERTHSAIGAASATTPFVMLTNKHDLRSIEIFRDSCLAGDLLIDMNQDVESVSKKINERIACRASIKRDLEVIRQFHQIQLKQTGKEIISCKDN